MVHLKKGFIINKSYFVFRILKLLDCSRIKRIFFKCGLCQLWHMHLRRVMPTLNTGYHLIVLLLYRKESVMLTLSERYVTFTNTNGSLE